MSTQLFETPLPSKVLLDDSSTSQRKKRRRRHRRGNPKKTVSSVPISYGVHTPIPGILTSAIDPPRFALDAPPLKQQRSKNRRPRTRRSTSRSQSGRRLRRRPRGPSTRLSGRVDGKNRTSRQFQRTQTPAAPVNTNEFIIQQHSLGVSPFSNTPDSWKLTNSPSVLDSTLSPSHDTDPTYISDSKPIVLSQDSQATLVSAPRHSPPTDPPLESDKSLTNGTHERKNNLEEITDQFSLRSDHSLETDFHSVFSQTRLLELQSLTQRQLINECLKQDACLDVAKTRMQRLEIDVQKLVQTMIRHGLRDKLRGIGIEVPADASDEHVAEEPLVERSPSRGAASSSPPAPLTRALGVNEPGLDIDLWSPIDS